MIDTHSWRAVPSPSQNLCSAARDFLGGESQSSQKKLVPLDPGSRFLLRTLRHGSATAWAGKKHRRQ